MSMMKKKPHRDELIGLQILHGLVFRHHSRRRRFPLFSALSGCLLLLFAVVLFLSPPVSDHTGHHRRLILDTSFNNRVGIHINAEKENVFRVPRSGGIIGRDVWTSNQSNLFCGCSNASNDFRPMKTEPRRYLLIATSGGLNQQRTGIVDAVVAAYILNATLVVPKLDQKSFWKDASNFSEIFNVGWFIKYLAKDVKIVAQLPETAGRIITTRSPRKCNKKCYETRIVPIYQRKRVGVCFFTMFTSFSVSISQRLKSVDKMLCFGCHQVQAVQLTKFDYRLSNRLDMDLQKLRCRVNYHALRFTSPIQDMGMKLSQRMRAKSNHYVALHLRYEPDMLAFSGCYYGGGVKETKELASIRKRWKTLHTKNPEKERRHGKCPLTPEEVGLMLRALGFGNDVHIYVASGEVYGGEETLAPLKALFPNIHTKETLASKEELAEFQSYSSRMAALDFIVCDESDVFVANNNGNMAKILAGKRRYSGHKPTIRPNAKKLYRLFNDRHNMTWNDFASHIRTSQVGFMGEPNEVKPGRGEFHEHPLPCICQKRGDSARNGVDRNNESNEEDEEQDLFETEYAEEDRVVPNRRDSGLRSSDQPELDEILSE
ncbi:protein ROOT HAIR SPECIFIC 17-like isoform X2 [Salvia splendens]|uniref:protein ROOT HAIR SPECIFIC 17-like isoform X2 n=1 Tax=Salvia splendens TaxID=180675 RepID=UPI001C254CCD|nr:protein ROOT HAIR SPECIFIC 17-like isoform X2 [Salvia splendens]